MWPQCTTPAPNGAGANLHEKTHTPAAQITHRQERSHPPLTALDPAVGASQTLSGSAMLRPAHQTVAVLVLEARPARTSFVSPDRRWSRRTQRPYTHLFPSDVEAPIGRLEDIRARSLAVQARPNDRSHGIEIGGG